MENSAATNTSANPQNNAENKQTVLNDIRAKWDKFSEQDVSALKGKDDLVSQLSAKYDMKPDQAQREVDTVLKGRKIGAGPSEILTEACSARLPRFCSRPAQRRAPWPKADRRATAKRRSRSRIRIR